MKSKNDLTKEGLNDRSLDNITVGKLKEFINKNNIPDTAKIVVERVEDYYYDNGGWGTLKQKGELWWNQHNLNHRMLEEIELRKSGEKGEYGMDDPSIYIMDEKDMEELYVEYTPVWCPVFYDKDDNILFLDMHY
jgi:hypothetical protein